MTPNAAFRNHTQFKRGHPRMERWLLQQALKAIGPAPIRLAVQSAEENRGEEVCPPGVRPVSTVLIRDLGTLAALMIDPEIAFSEAYAAGRIDVRGDLAETLTAVYQAWPSGRRARFTQ
jgi:cyclopropane-fatty-acyl-phospholipid synthase